jgi:hypothetical protein
MITFAIEASLPADDLTTSSRAEALISLMMTAIDDDAENDCDECKKSLIISARFTHATFSASPRNLNPCNFPTQV